MVWSECKAEDAFAALSSKARRKKNNNIIRVAKFNALFKPIFYLFQKRGIQAEQS